MIIDKDTLTIDNNDDIASVPNDIRTIILNDHNAGTVESLSSENNIFIQCKEKAKIFIKRMFNISISKDVHLLQAFNDQKVAVDLNAKEGYACISSSFDTDKVMGHYHMICFEVGKTDALSNRDLCLGAHTSKLYQDEFLNKGPSVF